MSDVVNIAVLGSEQAFGAFRSMVYWAVSRSRRSINTGSLKLIHISSEREVRGRAFHGLLRLAGKVDGACIEPVTGNSEIIQALRATDGGSSH